MKMHLTEKEIKSLYIPFVARRILNLSEGLSVLEIFIVKRRKLSYLFVRSEAMQSCIKA